MYRPELRRDLVVIGVEPKKQSYTLFSPEGATGLQPGSRPAWNEAETQERKRVGVWPYRPAPTKGKTQGQSKDAGTGQNRPQRRRRDRSDKIDHGGTGQQDPTKSQNTDDDEPGSLTWPKSE
jgi:hypothetical protein